MSDDHLQQLLSDWLRGSRKAGLPAVEVARDEWRGQVRAFLRSTPFSTQWEDVLETLVVDLLKPQFGGRPRALAPADAGAPAAWRRRVVRNALLDWRKAEQRRDAGIELVRGSLASESGGPSGAALELDALLDARSRVRCLIPRLKPRTRLIVGYLSGFDLVIYATELALELEIDEGALAAVLSRGGSRRSDDLLPLLFPGRGVGPDALRKVVERALDEVRALLDGKDG